MGAGHLARAALDAISYQVRDVFDVMQAEAGAALDTLLADGGASRSDLLMQFQADMLGCPYAQHVAGMSRRWAGIPGGFGG